MTWYHGNMTEVIKENVYLPAGVQSMLTEIITGWLQVIYSDKSCIYYWFFLDATAKTYSNNRPLQQQKITNNLYL